MDYLLTHTLQLFRETSAIGQFDVLCKMRRYLALILDILGNVAATERNGRIVPHNITIID